MAPARVFSTLSASVVHTAWFNPEAKCPRALEDSDISESTQTESGLWAREVLRQGRGSQTGDDDEDDEYDL